MLLVASRVQRRTLWSITRRCLLSTTTSSEQNPTLYMWGTNTKGTLLGAGDAKMWDVPTFVDWRSILDGT